MKFSQTINESKLKFKDFEAGMIVSVKRTPWDDEDEYEVDSIDKNVNDEVEVTLKNTRNGEEYIVDKNEMNIIEVKEVKRPKRQEAPKREKEDKSREKEKEEKEGEEEDDKQQNEELKLRILLNKLR